MLRSALNELSGLGDAPKLADAFLDLLPDSGVVIIDPDLRVVLMRGDVYERHGIDARLAVGRDLPDVIAASSWARVGELWRAALAGERRTLDSASDGEGHYWLHSAASIGDPGLIADIEHELERTGADPSRLVFDHAQGFHIGRPAQLEAPLASGVCQRRLGRGRGSGGCADLP